MEVLHADEFRPVVHAGRVLHLHQLVSPHGAGTDVAHFSRFDDVVEGFHGFSDGCVGVETVDLEEVDVF